MGLFLVWCHRLICIVLSLCKHAHKEVCNVNPGKDPYPLLARSCNRWWPDFVTFTACKKSRFGLNKGKKAQCVSNCCKDLFERKNLLGLDALKKKDNSSHHERGLPEVELLTNPIGHFTVVCLVTWPWMQARLKVTLLWYRPLCFSHVNTNQLA